MHTSRAGGYAGRELYEDARALITRMTRDLDSWKEANGRAALLRELGRGDPVGFVIAAALAAAAFLALPRDAEAPIARRGGGFIRAAARHARVYRLSLLFMSIYGVPMVLSAWLVEYLTREGSFTTSLAGVAAFILFSLSAATRIFGARLQQHGLPHRFLTGVLGLAAVGLGALALDPVTAVAFASVVIVAIGFGIPYATALTEAQKLYPSVPAEPVALMTLGPGTADDRRAAGRTRPLPWRRRDRDLAPRRLPRAGDPGKPA